jgi:hypothetical protein
MSKGLYRACVGRLQMLLAAPQRTAPRARKA